jgi:hypothetical protein
MVARFAHLVRSRLFGTAKNGRALVTNTSNHSAHQVYGVKDFGVSTYTSSSRDTMSKAAKDKPKKDDDSGDESDDDAEDAGSDDSDAQLKTFDLGRSMKLSGFGFVAFILLMSDVFVLRVLGRQNYDLVSGRCPTKKGLVCIGVLLAMSLVVLDFLIVKEKL